MTRDRVLPPTLDINQIQSYLNMNMFSTHLPEQQLCDHVNGKDFDLRLIVGQFDTYNKEDADRVDGALQIDPNATSLNFFAHDPIVNEIRFNEVVLFGEGQREASYTVFQIRDQGVDYYITEPDSRIIGALFYEDKFYCLSDELVHFRKEDIYKDTLDKNRLNEQFLDTQLSNSVDEELPQSLDPESEYYAEELHLAIQAHQAIITDKFGNQSLNRLSRVKIWLDKYKSDLNLSDAAIHRIASIISTNRIKRK